MKLEMEFSEKDSTEDILAIAKKRIEYMKKEYEDSLKRHAWLVQHLIEPDGSFNHRHNLEAEMIENSWTRMGVEF